jgi:hypothetical protein
MVHREISEQPARPERVDKQTGQSVIEKPNHHLMFIKMEYWGPIYLAIALAVLIYGLLKH